MSDEKIQLVRTRFLRISNEDVKWWPEKYSIRKGSLIETLYDEEKELSYNRVEQNSYYCDIGFQAIKKELGHHG